MIGVTGTDGKTTTSFLIYQILRAAGKKVGLIATTGAFLQDKKIDTGLHTTTPNPKILQCLISEARSIGCEYLVLEVTSHSLDQHRIWGINFDIAVLTNITHEHLDYHKSFYRYTLVKSKLFNKAKVAFINIKYSYFAKIIKKKNIKMIFYSYNLLPSFLRKTVFKRFTQDYNRENLTAAVLVAKEIGLSKESLVRSIKRLKLPEGRLDFVKNKRDIKIVIDFAHTPHGLEKLLGFLIRQKGKGKLIVVFGCAGERDKTKRPLMGKVASYFADILILTAEDPRSEKVSEINLQIKKGIHNKKVKVFEIENRGEAIYFAINKLAKKGDTVAICGKGHERSICLGDKEYSWSDRKAVLKSLEGRKLYYGKVFPKRYN